MNATELSSPCPEVLRPSPRISPRSARPLPRPMISSAGLGPSYGVPIICCLLLLAGCTVGPDYHRPQLETPVGFIGSSESASSTVDLRWWDSFEDSQLSDLVRRAVAGNLRLRVAEARVREAWAGRRATASAWRPQLSGSAGGEDFSGSELAPGPAAALASQGIGDLDGELREFAYRARWELDLFGGTRRAVQAADAMAQGQEEALRAARLAVVTEVARSYVELRGHQRRLRVARYSLSLQEQTRQRIEKRVQAGLAAEADLSRALAEEEASRSRLPTLRAGVSAALHRLGVLLGEVPGQLRAELAAEEGSAPEDNAHRDPSGDVLDLALDARWRAPDLVPTGLPIELLRRRPDLRQAERQLAAATAEVGVAVARRYPKLSLTGSAGSRGQRFSDLFRSAGRMWSLGPMVQWPILQGGRLRAGVDVAQARREQAEISFRLQLLRVLEEVESSLSRYGEGELQRQHLRAAVAASQRAVQLAQVLYQRGLESFLVVLDAERRAAQLADQLAAVETAHQLNLVMVYAALGGGWEVWEQEAHPALGVLSAETVPIETLPTETLPTETVPTETVPTETVPTETVPTETVPTETVPAELAPTKRLVLG